MEAKSMTSNGTQTHEATTTQADPDLPFFERRIVLALARNPDIIVEELAIVVTEAERAARDRAEDATLQANRLHTVVDRLRREVNPHINANNKRGAYFVNRLVDLLARKAVLNERIADLYRLHAQHAAELSDAFRQGK